jgi:hypothetical protein
MRQRSCDGGREALRDTRHGILSRPNETAISAKSTGKWVTNFHGSNSQTAQPEEASLMSQWPGKRPGNRQGFWLPNEPSAALETHDLETSRDFCRKEANERMEEKRRVASCTWIPARDRHFRPHRRKAYVQQQNIVLVEHPHRGSLRRRRESLSELWEYLPARGLSRDPLLVVVVVGTVGGKAHSCAAWPEENSQSHNLRYTLLHWFQFMMVIFVIYSFCRISLAMVDL